MNLEETEVEALILALTARHRALPRDLLSTYLHEIVNWNNRVALVSRRSTKTVLERLVNQSVGLLGLIEATSKQPLTSFVDIGTGAGFPGIIWKMMAPASSCLLVERREKKATFLDRVVRVLGLADVEVYTGDGRDAALRSDTQGAFDVATTLAVATPEDTVPLVRPFLRPGGWFVTVVGSSAAPPDPVAGMRLVCSEPHGTGALSVYQDPEV